MAGESIEMELIESGGKNVCWESVNYKLASCSSRNSSKGIGEQSV